jgi:uncharacterized protein YkwD
VHHLPSGPRRTIGLTSLVARIARELRPALWLRRRRLAVLVPAALAVTALMLAAPVVSGADGSSDRVALDSSSSESSGAVQSSESAGSSRPGSPVVMGVDGRPLPPSSPAAPGEPGSAPTAPDTSGAGEAADAPASVPETSSASSSAPGSTSSAPSSSAAGSSPERLPGSAAPEPEPAVTPAAPVAAGPEAQVVALVNAERAAAGCAPVVADAALADVARAHSADMRDRGFFSHVNPDQLDPFDRAAQAGLSARAENIAQGQPDAAAVMAAWMDSPGHRENILNCELTALGVGVAEGAGGPWWTQLLA